MDVNRGVSSVPCGHRDSFNNATDFSCMVQELSEFLRTQVSSWQRLSTQLVEALYPSTLASYLSVCVDSAKEAMHIFARRMHREIKRRN